MASTLESFSKWLQLKIYQLEVTMSVYIYTPIEKFIFYSVLFLLFSLTFIATVLYLPQHLQFIVSRAWFYMHGDSLDGGVAKGAIDVAAATTTAVGEALTSIAAAAAERVKEL
ncbi:uncharacterized protein C8A04DRAFT_23891 [Dichotomopilus funicola]|uniref:Uncharacterized protein n=1 Tax=Dichotomopilus funicola TaxID=1934379 RepID=A0AAN6VAY1_9PEZI|nr:hypothetical protein C8A04DRAFT_23891 [Dichotomopilus funicola]